MERGAIFLLGGVAAVGLGIFALAATGNLSVDFGSARTASPSEIGTVLQRTHMVDIAADGALKLDNRPSSLKSLPADLGRVAGKLCTDKQSIDLFAARGVTPARVEQVRGVIQAAGCDVTLSYQTGKMMRAAPPFPAPIPQ